MQVRLLGPVDVLVDGTARPVRGLRRIAVLAMLALHPGEIVSTDRLVDAVWGDDPPPTALNTVQSHVSHLRQVLGSRSAIGSRPPGYLLDIGAEGTDVQVAERLIRAAGAAADPADRARDLRVALALWRGQPLANLAALAGRPWLDEHTERLRRLWLQATRAQFEARLALGEHAELVPELYRLTEAHPYDEQLHAQLMLALYRGGRQADALAAYRRLQHALRDELGIDPGQPLRDLHAAVLRQDAALDPGPPVGQPPARASTSPSTPAQLPSATPGFVGRGPELAALDAALGSTARGVVVISAIAGTAGVGKTALAVQWSHRVADRFPDGQLYVNLRGYDPGQPMSAADALAGFLTGLGAADQDVPADLEQRAARYRTELSGRRMLVVLDNAASVEQVRPLLPGTPTALVLVTSRDSLAGLVALHGARRLELDLLPPSDANALLRDLIGARVDAEPEAVDTLARQCGRLPLALRVAAELAASRPATPLSELVAELADHRLDLLEGGGDPRAAVRAVFSWSICHLPVEAARVFRLFGLHPGEHADAYAVAALAGIGLPAARRALDLLTRAHLVHLVGLGRYGMHDLLRAYAADQAATEHTASERQAALTRLFDYYLAGAATAMDTLHPAERHRRPRVARPSTPVPDLSNPDTARAWLDGERSTLVAVAGYAATRQLPGYAVRLSVLLFRYLDGGHYADGAALHGHAVHAAQQIGDRSGEAQATLGLGGVCMQLGQHDAAAGHFEHALTLSRAAGDRSGEARALGNLGAVHLLACRYQAAAGYHRRALVLLRQLGDLVGEARTLTYLGSVDCQQGRYGQAADHLRQALAVFKQVGDPSGSAWALKILGEVEARLGELGPAMEHHREALALDRQLGNPAGEAWALTNIGSVHRRAGRPDQATRQHRQALDMFRLAGERYGEATALNGLGEAASAAGHVDEALAHHAAALIAAADCGGRDEEARANAGLAEAYRARADQTQADEHLRRALDLYEELDSAEGEQLRARLAASGQPARHAAGNRLAGHRRPMPPGGRPTSWAGR
ncbi:MAG TPA: tetratricopeptide repeat protein [Mycobacteriales bacterium]